MPVHAPARDAEPLEDSGEAREGALPAPAGTLAGKLLDWFAAHRRELPWRLERTPYRVWLSEVMLQQTQVAVVEDYYCRFLARFPDVASLAAASEDEVLALWSGLGYYSRGRNLLRAARAVVASHDGVFPARARALSELPGVGPYTAAAVASLAFGEAVAAVDGNVSRVLARLADDHRPVDGASGKAAIHAHAQALVDASGRPGPLNESLMELGALVCVPRAPRCDLCPWSEVCGARRAGTALKLPVKLPKRARRMIRVATAVVVDQDTGAVWLERRPGRGLFGGLHEPPSREVADDVEDAWRVLLQERRLPVPRAFPPPVFVERTLTHRDLIFAVLRVQVSSRMHPSVWWVDDVANVGTSTAVRAVLDAAGAVRGGAAVPRPGRV